MRTPATSGSTCDSSSWSPTKYQGALDGSGVRSGLASPRSGAAKATPSVSTTAAVAKPTTTWRTSRCGQVNTVSSTRRSSAVTDSRSTTPSRRTRCSPTSAPPAIGAARPLGGLLGERSTRRLLDREAVLADPPDVQRQQHRQGQGEHDHVQGIEAQQGRLADLRAAQEQVTEDSAQRGHIVDQV